MGTIGLITAALLLIWLALRGVDIILASLICATLVAITSQLSITEALTSFYAFGPLGAFTFAGKFFLLFVAGAVFGRIMGESESATAIAMALVRALGEQRVLVIITLAAAVLTYGGVVVFVVVFAMYPLGVQLIRQANIPKRLFCGALALGSGTFTLSALPGTPSVQNVISASALGTDLFAGAGLGLFAAVIMLVGGLEYLERQRRIAFARDEGFTPSPADLTMSQQSGSQRLPHWLLASLPIVTVLATILLPRLMLAISPSADQAPAWVVFASAQPIVWPSLALLIGSLVALMLFKAVRGKALDVMGRGTRDALMPLINTAAVIGFGGVVTQTAAFSGFVDVFTNASWPPLLSMFGSISLLSAITGSASGGLQIFMQTLAPHYLEAGIAPETLHRLVTIASGGFDSLPHCGAVVALLTIAGVTHREAYKDIGVITVVLPVAAALASIAVASF